MDRENLEILDEESLFRIQNTISEIIKERNNQKIKLTKNKIPFRDLSVTDSKIKKELLKNQTF